MSVAYLLGHPVAHSLSPAMHNAAFVALGMPHRYEARDVEPARLGDAVSDLRGGDALGANVTVPHKERILGLLDGVAEDAARIGAVNTVVRDGRLLRGENTDRGGFEAALHEAGIGLADKDVLVLGAGGAARAVVIALLVAGARVRVANRTAARAQDLTRQLGGRAVSWPDRILADVVVNATSLGLRGEDPLSDVDLPAGLVLIDLVPTGTETALVRRGRDAGCAIVDGLLMLLHQAAASFRLWTGVDAPIAAMRAALPRIV